MEARVTAQELRIGNLMTDEWFESFKTIITVDSINDKGINLVIEDDGNWSELAQHFIVPEHTFDELRPIPITEEWLLKLGFEQFSQRTPSEHIFIKDAVLIDILIDPSVNGFYVGVYDDERDTINPIIHIKHIHQLQNFYFALTGKELEHNG